MSTSDYGRARGWLILVHGLSPKRYAVIADDLDQAQALVSAYCSVTNEKLEFVSVLTDGDINRLGLKRGEVKLYA